MNKKKLLQITLNYYMIFATIVVLLAVPLFYIISTQLYIHETDEALELQKNEFQLLYANKLKKSEIITFNALNRDIEIEKISDKNYTEKFFTKNNYNPLEKENEPYRFIKSPITIDGQTYMFSSKVNLVDSGELLYGILFIFILILIILLVGLFFITRRLSTKLWQPFYQTLTEIENFEIDSNAKTTLNENPIEEFSRLNAALNKLVHKNRSIYDNQKEFIENAAHELQTPIAIFKANIETLLQQEDNSKKQFQLLEEINQTTSKLQRLNKNMLLLSKIGSKYYIKNETVVINEVIEQQYSFFLEQAKPQKITIAFKNQQPAEIQANLFLTEILIRNLFSNAINHNSANGLVEILVEKNKILFSNTGSTIPLEKEKLYQRFSKSNTATHGNGLGLAIVKNIVENQNWTITYSYENKMHQFAVTF